MKSEILKEVAEKLGKELILSKNNNYYFIYSPHNNDHSVDLIIDYHNVTKNTLNKLGQTVTTINKSNIEVKKPNG